MHEKNESIRTPDKRLAAVCGLFCPACNVFIGTREDQVRLTVMARRFQLSVEELHCNGCRSEKRCFYCESKCTMTGCAASKGVEFCGECSEYPCTDLKAFQSEMPHRIELWKAQERIKEVGYETWYREMIEHYSCHKCGTVNSGLRYCMQEMRSNAELRVCGPHKDEIAAFGKRK
jgi:hypothetical protein